MSAPPPELAAPEAARSPASEPRGGLRSRPSFFGAWRGIWLFTWKSRVTWRRLVLASLGLLAIPALVYITVSSPLSWTQHHPLLGTPAFEADIATRRLGHAALPLEPEQKIQIRRIFAEEFARAEGGGAEMESSGLEARREAIRTCYERILRAAKTVLNQRQFEEFQGLEERRRDAAVARLSEPAWLAGGLPGSASAGAGPSGGKDAAWGRTGPFYHWLVDFYFFVVLPLSCVSANGALIREELQADTLRFLLTRPVSRARLLVVKFLSQALWLELVVAIETLLLFAAGSLREIPGLGGLLPLFLAVQAVAVLVWGALGVFLGLVTRRYMAVSLVYGLIVEMGIGRIPTNINALSMMRHLKTLLAHNAALQGVYEWSGQGALASLGALGVACVAFVLLATLLFTFVEYHHTTEMQK